MVDPSAESVATPSKSGEDLSTNTSVFPYSRTGAFSTEDMIHQLRTIAQTENRDAKFK